MMRQVKVKNIKFGDKQPLVLIAGPCAIESEKLCLETGLRIRDIAAKFKVPYIFKSSFDKANRMAVDSFRGPGFQQGLEILQKVKDKLKCPILSDVHRAEDMALSAKVLDIIQIPAFLCRQTDILVEAAKTGKAVNIKKGQFLAPWDMGSIIKKAESTGNRQILLTERGSSFGYNNLVVDFRSLGIMGALGYPVIFDATHSVQLPGGKGNCSGGQSEFVEGLSRAAVAFGCQGLFLEVHPNPAKALCDGANMIDLKTLENLLRQIKKIEEAL